MAVDLEEVLVAADAAELDLTNAHLHNLEEVPLPETLSLLDLTANRLKALDDRVLKLPGLKHLLLRQNLMEDLSPIAHMASASGLLELVLYDNNISQLPDLSAFASLEKLDLSINQLRSMAPLSTLQAPSLRELYLTSNKLSSIESLSSLCKLELLELGDNRISQLAGLDSLQSLRELWLGRNRVTSISGLSSLTSLRRLSLQSNRLTSMKGIGACRALQELYLSHNGISQLEDVSLLPELQILDVSNNQLKSVTGLSSLQHLEDLWLNDNQIVELEDVNTELDKSRSTLTCVYLSCNPATRNNPLYKQCMLRWLPNLQQLDADYVRGAP
ncbi:hypothetical protein ABBQ38_005806 [Trebouxia sp. C0009 RCD-2024]